MDVGGGWERCGKGVRVEDRRPRPECSVTVGDSRWEGMQWMVCAWGTVASFDWQ